MRSCRTNLRVFHLRMSCVHIPFAVAATIISFATSTTRCNAAEAIGSRPVLHEQVDRLLSDSWRDEGIQAANVCDDTVFLRRAYLDLIGRVPRVSEVRDFLNDQRDDRRQQLITELVRRPGYATHMANVWRDFLLPVGTDLEQSGGIAGFETWLRERIARNVPYDEIVRELLTAEGAARDSGPALFFTAWELKSEKLAASTSRALLGMRLQCAECHDHPFGRWSQQDFWGYAAFFAQLEPAGMGPRVQAFRELDVGEVTLPETTQVVAPRFLGSQQTATGIGHRRAWLAHWMTHDDNPYFARAAVNRMWAQLFGRGLVDPLDDMGDHNPPRHPAVLDRLADAFRECGYDMRHIIQTLAQTQAYQLTSATADDSLRTRNAFAQMIVKSMSAEQLYDSLATATCKLQPPQAGGPTFGLNRITDTDRQAFLASFRAPSQDVSEYQLGIAQALTMMNGDLIAVATNVESSDFLSALGAPFLTDHDRVETIFLAAYSRPPTANEKSSCLEYLTAADSQTSKLQVCGDLLWALLNSAEFTLNR